MPAQMQFSEFASDKQIAFVERLVEERELTDYQVEWTLSRVRRHKDPKDPFQITKAQMRQIIGKAGMAGLLNLPVREGYEKDHFAALVPHEPKHVPENFTEVTEREELRHYSDGDSIAVITEPNPNFSKVRPVRQDGPAKIGIYRVEDNVYVVRKARGSNRVYALKLVASPPRLAANGNTVHHDFEMAPGMVWNLHEEDRITDDDEVRALSIKVGACVMCGHAIWQAKSVRRMMGTRCYKRVHGLPIR